jgi:quinohemoprotein ethanol dehydrogenase
VSTTLATARTGEPGYARKGSRADGDEVNKHGPRSSFTGEMLWDFVSDVDPQYPGRWANRGVDIADGKLFATQKDGNVVALDQKTGKLLWRTSTNDEDRPRTLLSNAPLYWNGLVYTGVSGAGQATLGRFLALDANTGAIVWRFNTIPVPGELNFGTWEGESWRTGGGNVWNTATIDPDLGFVYVQTGNAWPDYGGVNRGGDNLYTASVIALDARTGAYKWHYQTAHHDIWDYDIGTTPMLHDITMPNGTIRKAVTVATKQGWLFILDRATGEPIVGIEEQPVPQEPRQKTAPTQPHPLVDAFVPQCGDKKYEALGYNIGCVYEPYWDVPTIGGPATDGGADWAPISYSPQTNLIYVTANIQETPLTANVRELVNGEIVTRLAFGGAAAPLGSTGTGNITALDAATNKIVWQKDMPYGLSFGSGAMTTAGGLLFHGEPDGNFMALDARTGEVLWRFQTGFPADGPAMTYEIDGTQYVAIAAGGTTRSGQGDAVWAFKLGGRLPAMPYGPPPPPTVVALTGNPVATGAVSMGPANAEFSFAPQRIRIPAGSAVTWTNEGSLPHTATSQSGPSWTTQLLNTGESESITFDTPGRYVYFCTPHPWMIGDILVE